MYLIIPIVEAIVNLYVIIKWPNVFTRRGALAHTYWALANEREDCGYRTTYTSSPGCAQSTDNQSTARTSSRASGSQLHLLAADFSSQDVASPGTTSGTMPSVGGFPEKLHRNARTLRCGRFHWDSSGRAWSCSSPAIHGRNQTPVLPIHARWSARTLGSRRGFFSKATHLHARNSTWREISLATDQPRPAPGCLLPSDSTSSRRRPGSAARSALFSPSLVPAVGEICPSSRCRTSGGGWWLTISSDGGN